LDLFYLLLLLHDSALQELDPLGYRKGLRSADLAADRLESLGVLHGGPGFTTIVVVLLGAEDELRESQSVECLSDHSGHEGVFPADASRDLVSINDWLL
jgi:hypothetical protein